jgi:hypothetical protein
MKWSDRALFAAFAAENEFDIVLISIKCEVCEGCDTGNRRYHRIATKLLICWWRRRYTDCLVSSDSNLVLILKKRLRTSQIQQSQLRKSRKYLASNRIAQGGQTSSTAR